MVTAGCATDNTSTGSATAPSAKGSVPAPGNWCAKKKELVERKCKKNGKIRYQCATDVEFKFRDETFNYVRSFAPELPDLDVSDIEGSKKKMEEYQEQYKEYEKVQKAYTDAAEACPAIQTSL